MPSARGKCMFSDRNRVRPNGPRLVATAALALSLAACQSMGGAEGGGGDMGAMPPPAAAGAPPPPPPPPPVFRVRSASPAVLEKFPRGSEVTRKTRICLEEGEQLTIVGSNGQSVTYTGPGCMQRSAPSTSDNVGGFTFGYNSRYVGTEQERAR